LKIHISRAGDLAQVMGWRQGSGYHVVCFDPYDSSWYPDLDFEGPEFVPTYATEVEAQEAAQQRIDDFSGGKYGRQEVFIVHPDGMMVLLWPVD